MPLGRPLGWPLVLLTLIVLGLPLAVHAEDTGSITAPLAEKSLLLDIARAGSRLVAVGERGHVLLSDDNGSSWRQVSVPTVATLTGVSFTDAANGWAVGHDALILHSSDGGESWQQQYRDAALESPLLDLDFTDPQHGLASGAYGLLLSTDDAGASWQRLTLGDGDDFHLNAIATIGGVGYLAAEAGMLYRADGEQWKSLPSPYEGSFFGLLPLPDGGMLLLGLRGHLYRSEVAGSGWSTLESGTESTLTDALRLNDGTIVIVGHAGTVLWSTDGGSDFKLLQLSGRPSLSAVVQAADGRLLAVGEQGIHAIDLPKADPQ